MVLQGLCLLLVLLIPIRASGQSLDHGRELYQSLLDKAVDDRWKTLEQAAQQLQTLDRQREANAWIQNFLFVLDTAPDKIPAAWKSPESLSGLIKTAEEQKLDRLILPLSYHRQDAADKRSIFVEKAIQADDIRLAVHLLLDGSYRSYNEGNMQQAFQQSKRAFALLENRVPADDIQMLELKGKMAMYLENEQEMGKAEEIYSEIIRIYERRPSRTALGDVYFNYALLLAHKKDLTGAERYYKKVASLGEALNADLYRGQGLRGLGYTQFHQERFQEAAESYAKALQFMIAAEDDPVAIADTYKLLGSTFVELKDYDKALANFDIAEKSPLAMEDKVWQNNLLQSRLDAYVGMGRIQEGLDLAVRINALLIDYMLKTREEDTNKVKVSMGLLLEEQKSKALAEQNRLFYGLLILAALMILLLAVVLRQTQKAKHSRERMHRILEHIDEGILCIGRDMKVEADLSPYLARLLDVQDKTKDMFTHLLEASLLRADEQATLRAALQASLGEESLAWDLNAGLLPEELSIQKGQKQISLEWQALYGEDRRIHNVLITVRDITARKSMQAAIDQAQARASHMQQRILDILKVEPHRLEAFLGEARPLLARIRPLLSAPQELAQGYGQLHTLKGMARSLGFKEISNLAHELEHQIDLPARLLKNPELVFRLLDQLEETLRDYADIVGRLFLREGAIGFRKAETLLDLVTELLDPVRKAFEDAGLAKPSIHVQDHVRAWPQDWLDALRLVLLHGLTNAVDHGFVLPKQRGEAADRLPALEIMAQEAQTGLVFELRDNGVGLNRERLKILAEKVGFAYQSDHELGNVIFMEGISTAESVSKTSGRGMGMAAVKHAVTTLQGEITFRPNPAGFGSSLVVHIPMQRLLYGA